MSLFDMNDAEKQRGGDLIPDGSFAKLKLSIRPGGVDGMVPGDAGLLKSSASSDAILLDCEFTVIGGQNDKRKLWQVMVTSGGKLDDKGVSKGWSITKSLIRGMIESATGTHPDDISETAKKARQFSALKDLDGIEFFAKVIVEPAAEGSGYKDQNRIDRAIVPGDKQYDALRAGQEVQPEPVGKKAASAAAGGAAVAAKPSWANATTAGPTSKTVQTGGAPATVSPVVAEAAKAGSGGPAWLNGGA